MPLPAERKLVEEVAAALPPGGASGRPRPWWIHHVAANRDLWYGTALQDESGGSLYLLLFAKQSPYEGCFLELREQPMLWPGSSALPNDGVDERPSSWREFAFLDPFRVVRDSELPLGEDACILVWARLRFRGSRVFAKHEPRPFEDFIRFHPRRQAPAPRAAKASRRKASAGVGELLLEQFPWLSKSDVDPQTSGAKRSRRDVGQSSSQKVQPTEEASGGESDASSASPASPFDDPASAAADAVDVSAELADLRALLAVPSDAEGRYYRFAIRGGNWTSSNVGVAADCAMGIFRDKQTGRWAETFHFPLSKSFKFNLYSRDAAIKLAREFLRRANYFAGLYFDSTDDNFVYAQHHVAACGDCPGFVSWLCSLDPEDPALRRGQEIRSISPVIG